MREILFRGKDVDNPHEWVYGFLSVSGEENPGFVIDYPIKDFNVYGQVDIIPDTAGQFIGLTDKNGKKIFEDDIVQAYFRNNHTMQIFRVIFDDGMFLFDNNHVKVPKYEIYAMKVIGNIHDNPELVEECE